MTRIARHGPRLAAAVRKQDNADGLTELTRIAGGAVVRVPSYSADEREQAGAMELATARARAAREAAVARQLAGWEQRYPASAQRWSPPPDAPLGMGAIWDALILSADTARHGV